MLPFHLPSILLTSLYYLHRLILPHTVHSINDLDAISSLTVWRGLNGSEEGDKIRQEIYKYRQVFLNMHHGAFMCL